MRKFPVIILLMLLLAGWWWLQHPATPAPSQAPAATSSAGVPSASVPQALPRTLPGFLPREALTTLDLIARDGPFPHPQDGATFGNREKHLPQKPRGYYREYTVETPGLSHRGARRIITGGRPPVIYYYTDDHYDSFRSFTVSP
ncbi:ribonuclease [Pseudoxanthomonas gei]|uniref:Ribonuclease n=1 Tax=Pseudoxanthomonas gei TaxID=1383030 RepID=A0ABX0AJA2_9GAMM|nr:ribonuclease domain-containing protein [Pseudoxanthomonas gei]NDK40170.1 ribonuclease [Pseudoxanthomonas gei]